MFRIRRPGVPRDSVAMHGVGLGAGPGLPAWLQLLGRRRRRRRPGARWSSGLRLRGGGAADSARLRRLVPQARAGTNSRGSSSSSRGHQSCCARHRRPWPQAGSRLGRARGRLESAVYAAAVDQLHSVLALRWTASHFRGLEASAQSDPSTESVLSLGMGTYLGWSERVLPPSATEAGGGGEGGEGKGGNRGRRWPGGARVCRALGLRG